MENIIVAVSNLASILPLYTSYAHNDIITMSLILFVSLASFMSHLVENHKHGMPGIGFSKKTSYLLNRLDVIGVILLGIRLIYLYYHKYGLNFFPIMQQKKLFIMVLILFILLRISEYDKYNPKYKKMYILNHFIWHIGIYYAINVFLINLIY
jgi:uncharacterized membrane protein YadS